MKYVKLFRMIAYLSTHLVLLLCSACKHTLSMYVLQREKKGHTHMHASNHTIATTLFSETKNDNGFAHLERIHIYAL